MTDCSNDDDYFERVTMTTKTFLSVLLVCLTILVVTFTIAFIYAVIRSLVETIRKANKVKESSVNKDDEIKRNIPDEDEICVL